jgi:predicted DNA-binding protein YlxM (UPF0122 family)
MEGIRMLRGKPTDPEFALVEASFLLDTYGMLLTERQREFMRLHFEEDLSFSEIAREFAISRQAVHDSVKHAVQTLRNFEERLGLVGKARNAGPQIGGYQLIARLSSLRLRLENEGNGQVFEWMTTELDDLIAQLGGDPNHGGSKDV